MRIIKKHGLDEVILTQVFGWKWMSFEGIPTRSTKGYPEKCRVRELFSPKQLKSKNWQKYFKEREGREADGSEPLSYSYCSSMGPTPPPRLFILVDDSWSG